MLNNNPKKIIWVIQLAIVILGIIVGCSPNTEKQLTEAITEYKQKESGSIENIESAFTKLAAFELINTSELIISEKVLYSINQDSLTTFAPIRRTVHLPAQFPTENVVVSISKKYTVVSDGKSLLVFNNNGELGQSVILGDGKNLIRDIIIEDSIVYLFKERKIFVFDIEADSVSLLNGKIFTSPYGTMNYSSINISGKWISFIIGAAGVYSLTIINIPQKNFVVKNLSVTSNRFCFLSDSIIYIEGGAASWNIVALGIETKRKLQYNHFSDIVDIHLAHEGYFLENSKGRCFGFYGERPTAFPFKMKIVSVCGSVLLAKTNNQYYIAPTEKVFKYMKKIKIQMPELLPYL